jgi:hypothetical protein
MQAVDQIRWQQAARQGQQFAARSAYVPGPVPLQAAPQPRRLPGLPGLDSDGTPPSGAAAETGSRWPTLLGDSRFDVPRAKLDKLLAAAEASQAGLTSAEYEEIVRAANEMKSTLRQMAPELNASEYLMVNDFLDKLISEYQSKANPTQ